MRLIRARRRKGVVALFSQILDERGARKRLRPQEQKLRIGHSSQSSQIVTMRMKMLHDHMSEDQLDVFGALRVINGKVDGNIAHCLCLAAVEPQNGETLHANDSRLHERSQNIARIAAA